MSNDKKQHFNPLIVIPSPRDIDIVEKNIEDILIQGNNSLNKKYDVLWIKYYPALQGFNIGAKYFLSSEHHKEEYSHLCMMPDDLVVTAESFDKLVSELQQEQTKKKKKHYDVLSGVCNMTLLNNKEINQANVTFKDLPDPSVYTTKEIMNMFPTFDELGSSDIPQKVLFAGFPVTFIHRKIIEKMVKEQGGFTPLLRYNCCYDLMFCKFLIKNNIDHYIIPSARFLHLRQDPNNKQTTTFYVGKKQPYTKLV